MRKPWYNFLYVRSPIAKILLGGASLVLTLALFGFTFITEEPRMQAQTGNWEGREIEKGAEIFANNCTSCHGIDGKGLPGVAPALYSRYFFTQRIVDVGFTGTLHDYVAGTVAAGRPSNSISQWAQMMPTWGVNYGGPLRNDQVQAVTAFVMNWEADALTQTAENDPWQPFQNAKTTTITGTITTAASGPVEGEVRAPDQLFITMGCQGCHNLEQDQTANNRGPIAPNLGNLDTEAGNMVAGQDALTYVINSITHPNDFVVQGYGAGIMPQNFPDRLSTEEIANLAQWLLDQAAAN